jgi:prolyl 4-hydroxylase
VSAGPHDVESLRAQARASSITALTRLGKQLLVGEGAPAAPAKGVEVLEEAALRGDAEAHRQLSVCAAWGVGRPRDFARALESLELAAHGGSSLAQDELRLLAGSGAEDWASLHRSVDVVALTAPRNGRVVMDRPRIVVVERFMSPAECNWVIARGRPSLQRARVYHSSATPQVAETRTNRETSFTIFQADVALALMRERMSCTTRAPPSCFEVAKLLHYEPGQQFALHADFIQPSTPELVREVQLRGQRAATLLVYLNDDYEGGETDFPRINFRFKGRLGDALIFSNIDPAGEPDYDTVHAGLPPTTGQKWLFSQWIRTRPMVA